MQKIYQNAHMRYYDAFETRNVHFWTILIRIRTAI